MRITTSNVFMTNFFMCFSDVLERSSWVFENHSLLTFWKIVAYIYIYIYFFFFLNVSHQPDFWSEAMHLEDFDIMSKHHSIKICDEEDTAIRDQVVMLVDSWNLRDRCVSLIRVCMTKSKQRHLSVGEAVLDRAKQLSIVRTFVPSSWGATTWQNNFNFSFSTFDLRIFTQDWNDLHRK